MLQGNVDLAKEHMALLLVAMEQSALDQGDWTIAFLLSLSEEPPIQLYQNRMVSLHGQGRPFSPLVPNSWSAVCLAYLKEIEVLSSKKADRDRPQNQSGVSCRPSRYHAISKTQSTVPQEAKGCREGSIEVVHGGIRPGSTPNEERSAAGGFLHVEKEEPTVDVTMSFPKWCACLTSQVLRTRTAFSKFFVDSLSSQESPLAPSPALFPLALPGGFPKMIPGASSRLRRKIHFERVVYIMVLALNYWHFGGSFIPCEVLRRKPSSQQMSVHRRLRGFLKSEAVAGTFKISAAGRKFPQLSARLAELSSAVTFLGLSGSPYTKAFQGAEVAKDNSVMEELEPYRSLDASRLKLSGSGRWDITPWLPDELVMAYREPASIYIDRVPHPGEYPRMSDSPEELNKLAKVWDARGLLFLHHEEVPEHEQVRIFNCYKGPLIDRQIGDRRGRNAMECNYVAHHLCYRLRLTSLI